MRVVRLKDQQLGRAEVLTSHGEALEKNGAEKRTLSAEGGAVGRLILERLRGYDLKLIGRPGRHPIPRYPDAARIKRAYKLRQQPAETPGACIARGSFLWRSRCFSAAAQILPECVARQPHFLIID